MSNSNNNLFWKKKEKHVQNLSEIHLQVFFLIFYFLSFAAFPRLNVISWLKHHLDNLKIKIKTEKSNVCSVQKQQRGSSVFFLPIMFLTKST